MPFIVGLTGGIGSGKSAVADLFASLGVPVVDTDAIAHALTAPGGKAIPAITAAFGPGSIDAHGALDRAAMRRRVFAEPDIKRRLEAILHPMIRAAADSRLQETTAPYSILVVPLLVESGAYKNRVDRVLLVDCDEEVQVARTTARSDLEEMQVRAIMAAQANRATRLAAADDVIDNNGDIAGLRPQVESLHQRYLAFEQTKAAKSRN